jgi:putative peptidoglycan lipid II flippase
MSSSSRHLFKNASITTVLGGLGVATGVVTDALILGAFGMGYQTDAYFSAVTLPLLLTSVFNVQCPRVLVPAFAECFGSEEPSDRWRLFSNLLTTGFFILGAVSFAGMALSNVIIPIQIPGLTSSTVSLAVSLNRILFWLVLTQGLGAILQSLLFSQQRFLIASSGKLVTNLLTIALVAVARRRMGIHAVAAGLLLGSMVQLASLMMALGRRGLRYRWVFSPGDPKLREIIRSFAYPLAGHTLGETSTLVQNFLGSFLSSGSLSAIRYAARIVQALAGIFLGSVVQVTLPMISTAAASNDLRGQRRTFLEGFQLLSLVGIPICLWLIVASQPLLILLFERGAFSRASAVLTGTIIGLMTPDLFLGRVAGITQLVFYANKDTKVPFNSALIYTVAHVVFATILVRAIGVYGFPIAMCLASLSYATYMIVMVERRFGPMGWMELRSFAGRLVVASAVGAIGYSLGAHLAGSFAVSYSIAKVTNFVVPTTAGIATFSMAAVALGLVDRRFLFFGVERDGVARDDGLGPVQPAVDVALIGETE